MSKTSKSTMKGSFSENNRIFTGIKEEADWCLIRIVKQMELQKYARSGASLSFKADPNTRREDFFGKVLFDKRKGKSAFTPAANADFFHYCDGIDTNQEAGAIDGCGKLAVYPTTDSDGNITGYEFPVWKVADDYNFREGAAYVMQVNGKPMELEGDNGVLASVGGENVLVKGLTSEPLKGYYLIPMILPERLVVYYATKDESVIQSWLQIVNDYKNHVGEWLICGFETPLFRDDELSIFVTFNVSLKWKKGT